MVHLEIGSIKIDTTTNHPFWIEGKGWIGAGELNVGDVVTLANGENAEITNITIEKLAEPVKVYNFEVSDWHTYYVADVGVLVHNTCGGNKGTDKNSNNLIADNIKRRVPNEEVVPPTKRGNAPISIKDGLPIEIHHDEQKSNGPFFEMHPSEHRYGKNYKENHPNYNEVSEIDRKQFRKDRKKYWKGEWDNGRWK